MFMNNRMLKGSLDNAVLILLTLVSWQCSENPATSPPTDEPIDISEAEKALIESDNEFGIKLLRAINESETDKNVFISPLSVAMSLGMAYNGAAGATREAIGQTLELTGMTLEEVNKSYQHLIITLAQLDPQVQMVIANSIWVTPEKPLLDSFIDIGIEYFDAEVMELSFRDPQAAAIINRWVDEKTNGKIKDIVEDPIDPEIVGVLLNAIYFKGIWTYQFDEEQTRYDTFYLPDGSQKQVSMMAQRILVKCFKNEKFDAIELPYGNGSFSMTILLPYWWTSVDELISEFQLEQFIQWLSCSSSDSLDILLPKFALEYEMQLNDVLTSLGMGIAFGPGADFSNMFQGGGPWISKSTHKTFVEVNEEGTEAAAATSIEFVESISDDFIVDHPFLFVIREKTSGVILFIGKIVDPTAE